MEESKNSKPAEQQMPPTQPANPQVIYVEKPTKKPVWKRWWFWAGTIILLIIIISSLNSGKSPAANQSASASQSNNGSTAVTTPDVRQVQGTATTLGAGTFTAGKDVAVGLYDVTPGAGQSGNFIISGSDSVDEILGNAGGQGVTKLRVKISTGDSIQISSLSKVIFTPVTAPFVTAYQATTLSAGTWTVGEDIAAGRYIATPGSGQSGNFIVSGNDSVDEILGSASGIGVPSVTVNLTKGDVIELSSLNQVTFTPSN